MFWTCVVLLGLKQCLWCLLLRLIRNYENRLKKSWMRIVQRRTPTTIMAIKFWRFQEIFLDTAYWLLTIDGLQMKALKMNVKKNFPGNDCSLWVGSHVALLVSLRMTWRRHPTRRRRQYNCTRFFFLTIACSRDIQPSNKAETTYGSSSLFIWWLLFRYLHSRSSWKFVTRKVPSLFDWFSSKVQLNTRFNLSLCKLR